MGPRRGEGWLNVNIFFQKLLAGGGGGGGGGGGRQFFPDMRNFSGNTKIFSGIS
jgi:hypothetical protein